MQAQYHISNRVFVGAHLGVQTYHGALIKFLGHADMRIVGYEARGGGWEG